MLYLKSQKGPNKKHVLPRSENEGWVKYAGHVSSILFVSVQVNIIFHGITHQEEEIPLCRLPSPKLHSRNLWVSQVFCGESLEHSFITFLNTKPRFFTCPLTPPLYAYSFWAYSGQKFIFPVFNHL